MFESSVHTPDIQIFVLLICILPLPMFWFSSPPSCFQLQKQFNYLSLYHSIYHSITLSLYLFIYLSLYLFISLSIKHEVSHVCLSVCETLAGRAPVIPLSATVISSGAVSHFAMGIHAAHAAGGQCNTKRYRLDRVTLVARRFVKEVVSKQGEQNQM